MPDWPPQSYESQHSPPGERARVRARRASAIKTLQGGFVWLIATCYRKADIKLKLYATLFSQVPSLEEAVVVVDEMHEQLHADLAKRERRLQ